MLPEYDFRGSVRGKHVKSYRSGHTVKIHKANRTTVANLPSEGKARIVVPVKTHEEDAAWRKAAYEQFLSDDPED